MKIWILTLLITAIHTPTVFAETFSYPLENIDSLEISAGVEFEIRCGEVSKVDISAASEDSFKLSITDNKLNLKRKSKFNWFFISWGDNDVEAYITLKKSPHRIEINAGSEGEMDGCFNIEENLMVSASSGSSIRIDSNEGSLNTLEAHLSSGASIRIGETLKIASLNLEASTGSSFVSDEKVIIRESEVEVSTGAFAEICGTATITGSVSTGASVSVPDNTLMDTTVSTGGSTRKSC